MGAFTFTDQLTSPVAPARLFKALIVDAPNLVPKLVPEAIKSIETSEGNGVGSIRTINFSEGSLINLHKKQLNIVLLLC